MSLAERILELRGDTTSAEFCRRFNIHRNTLPRYESGQRVPDADFIINVCKAYHVHTDWFLLGKLPKHIGESSSAEINQGILKDAIEGLENALESKNRYMEPKDKAEIISEIYQLLVDEEREENKQSLAKILRLVA